MHYLLLLWRKLHNQLFLMNPFDPNYKAQISMKDLERSRRTSYQASRVVNKQRLAGVEPSKSYSTRIGAYKGTNPEAMTLEMAEMTPHKRTLEKKDKK